MIAADIPERLLPDALGATQALSADYGRALLLTQGVRFLPDRSDPGAALEAARSVTLPFDRANALAELAAVLPPSDRNVVIAEALAVAESISFPFWRAQALVELLPQLPETLRPRALKSFRDGVANANKFPLKSQFLLELAQTLPAPENRDAMGAAVTAARAVDDPINRGAALALLSASEAGARQQTLMNEARETLTAVADEGSSPARVWIRVLQSLPDRLISAGLRAVLDLLLHRGARDLPRLVAETTRLLPATLVDDVIELIHTEAGYRLETALSSVVLQLPETIRESILNKLLNRPGEASRRAILAKACSTWRDPLDADQRAILRRCLDSPSLDTTLCTIAAAAPLIYQEQGPEAIAQVLETVTAIQRWWPRTVAIATDDETSQVT